MVSLGLKSERMAKLIPTALPSVHANLSACPVPRSRDTVCHKRDIATMLTDASQQETMDSVILGISPCPPPLLMLGHRCTRLALVCWFVMSSYLSVILYWSCKW
ncbi:hypothetical protein AALO_G00304730 [Alosa alosa]|uniref:Uncharacterized protein n=1 Tax=Alosa alosa TaxID=278164 RepID=A0AAV6FIF2_9TELE|nr:hypothetical protein AALO_G00304730 [Alosa alosa]